MPAWFHWDGNDLILQLRIQPRASRDEFAGIVGDSLKVRLTAPPLEGRANDHLIAFLAKAFGVPQRRVQLEQGAAAAGTSACASSPPKPCRRGWKSTLNPQIRGIAFACYPGLD